IGPDSLVAGVEDVGAIDMGHHPGLGIALRMAIASHVRALVDHQDFVPGLRQSAADDRAAESSADDAISHSVDVRLLFFKESYPQVYQAVHDVSRLEGARALRPPRHKPGQRKPLKNLMPSSNSRAAHVRAST